MFDLSRSCGMVATRHKKNTSGTQGMPHALCSGQLLRSAVVFPGHGFVKAAIDGECGARQKHILLVGGDELGHAPPVKTPNKVARKDSARCSLHAWSADGLPLCEPCSGTRRCVLVHYYENTVLTLCIHVRTRAPYTC